MTKKQRRFFLILFLHFTLLKELQQFQQHDDRVGFLRDFIDVGDRDVADIFRLNWHHESYVILAVRVDGWEQDFRQIIITARFGSNRVRRENRFGKSCGRLRFRNFDDFVLLFDRWDFTFEQRRPAAFGENVTNV